MKHFYFHNIQTHKQDVSLSKTSSSIVSGSYLEYYLTVRYQVDENTFNNLKK